MLSKFFCFKLIIFISLIINTRILANTDKDNESSETILVTPSTKLSNSKRFTNDGRPCANSFIYMGENFHNCVKTLTPDGSKKDKEWCFVENPQEGFRDWDYCISVMDYDYIREYNQILKKETSKSISELTKRISYTLTPGEKILEDLKILKNSQKELILNAKELVENLEKIRKQLDNLNLKKELLITQKASIEVLKNKISVINENDPLSNHDRDQGSHKFMKNNLYSCKGMWLYEEEEEGNGLLGRYYNNEIWEGEYINKIQREIFFNWAGANPLPKINSNNFSVVWEGFIKVPISGKYVFFLEADDGYELMIRDEVVIRNGLDLEVDSDNIPLYDIGRPASFNDESFKSNPIILESDSKIKIHLKYYHSDHNDVVEKEEAYIRLSWSTDDTIPEIIDKKYFFTRNKLPLFKIFIDKSTSNFRISKLHENDAAFINNDNYFLQDIPKNLIGSTALKFLNLYKETEIRFYINLPCIVNVGVSSDVTNPLDESFEQSDIEFSLVRIEINKNIPTLKYLRGVKSGTFLIHHRSYEAGYVTIPLKFDEKNQEGIPLIVFFSFDKILNQKIVCSGDDVDISKPSGNYFKKCSASSEWEGMDCLAGFSGDYKDEEGSMWASFNEDVGAWIEIEFNGIFLIKKFIYKNRKHYYARNKVLNLNFSQNRKRVVNLKNSDDIVEIPIVPIKSNRVKITIEEVYGELNNGGAFGFIGEKCEIE